MLKAYTRSKLFIKAFLSYIVILIVPIYLFSGILFYFDIEALKTNAINKCYEEAQNSVAIIDEQLLKIQTLSGRISTLSWVWRLTAETDIFENEYNQIRKKQIVDDLQIFIDDDGLISNMIILFPKKGYAISMNGWWNSIDSYIQYLGIDKELFDTINLKNNYNFTLPFSEQLIIQNQQVIWLVHSIDKIKEPRAQVIFSIDQNKLKKFIEATSPDTLNNITIYSMEDKPVLSFDRSQQNGKEELLSINLPSNVFGWKYKMTFDASYHTAWKNKMLVLVLTLLCTLILSPFAAFALAYLSYRPLKKMMGRIMPDDSVPTRGIKRMNEYNILESVFSQLKSDNRQMERRVIEFSKYAKNDMLVRLLKGYFKDYEHEGLSHYGIDYSDENIFAVLIISVIENGLPKDNNLQKTIMAGILVEKLLESEKIDYKIIDILEEDIVVIFSDCRGKLDNASVSLISQKLQERLKELEGSEAKIWCGKIEKGILGISKSYHNARESINMSNFAKEMYDNIDVSKTLYYPTDWEIQLINNLKMGKEDAVLNILDEIRLENDSRMLNSETQDALYKSIKNTITRVSIELNMNWLENEVENNIEDYLENINDRNRASTKQWAYIYGISHMICTRKLYQEQENNDLAPLIMDYINKNYANASLSLKEIAYDLGVSQSTASKAFKNAYGIKFYDYTCRIRVEKAKELLKNTDMSVRVICKEVGYENEFSLRRTFLRYEGISTSEYQNTQKVT